MGIGLCCWPARGIHHLFLERGHLITLDRLLRDVGQYWELTQQDKNSLPVGREFLLARSGKLHRD